MHNGGGGEGKISDLDFSKGIEYLIQKNIILVPPTITTTNVSSETQIPEWIRNNANWWSQDLVSDQEFTQSIQYLINQQIIQI